MKDLVELSWSDTHYSCLLVDHALLEHIHCHVESSKTCSLTNAALEHPKLTVLDSELDVLHILEVSLELETDSVKLLVNLRH